MIQINGIERVELTHRIESVKQRISDIEKRFGIGGEGGSFQATLDREIAKQEGSKQVQPTQKSAETQRVVDATQPINENEAANAAKVAEALKSANKSSQNNAKSSARTLPGEEALPGNNFNLTNPANGNSNAAISSETARRVEENTPQRSDKKVSSDFDFTGNSTEQLINQAAAKYGVDEKLVKAIATAESNMNQNAISDAGAVGVMQLMPSTAASLGVDPYDERENIEGGAKYIRQMLDTFGGNVRHAVAAYNAGPGAVQKYGGVPPYSETKNYVGRVMDMYR